MGNGFFAKTDTYSPVNNATGGNIQKYLDPAAYALFGGYKPRTSGPGTPGPYAGRAATLADSNTGYAFAPGANGTGPTYKASSGIATEYNPNNPTASQNPYAQASVVANTKVPGQAQPNPYIPGGQTRGF